MIKLPTGRRKKETAKQAQSGRQPVGKKLGKQIQNDCPCALSTTRYDYCPNNSVYEPRKLFLHDWQALSAFVNILQHNCHNPASA
mmetsp:Transcript_36757/g.65746  ORF Transcript_36757/g.65746 Transcript_36757/m.65746 type:complete len:85 (+) Transcript_36757:257-511(+)